MATVILNNSQVAIRKHLVLAKLHVCMSAVAIGRYKGEASLISDAVGGVKVW